MVVAQRVRTSYIVVDSGKCKGCRLCVHACPKSILTPASHMNEKGYLPAIVASEKAEACTGCAVCALMCPDAAITVYRHDEVPSHSMS